MNKNCCTMDTAKFVRNALAEKHDDLLCALTDGLVCTRNARRQDMQLNKDGHTALVRLMEIYCRLCQPDPGSTVEGWDKEVLEMLLTCILAWVLLEPVTGSEGLAICEELIYMMGELVEGNWFA